MVGDAGDERGAAPKIRKDQHFYLETSVPLVRKELAFRKTLVILFIKMGTLERVV